VLKEGDEKSEQILAAAIEQGIQNPLNNNQPYKMGDTIYIKASYFDEYEWLKYEETIGVIME